MAKKAAVKNEDKHTERKLFIQSMVIALIVSVTFYVVMFLVFKDREKEYRSYKQIVIDNQTYAVDDTKYVDWSLNGTLTIILPNGKKIVTTSFTLIKDAEYDTAQ